MELRTEHEALRSCEQSERRLSKMRRERPPRRRCRQGSGADTGGAAGQGGGAALLDKEVVLRGGAADARRRCCEEALLTQERLLNERDEDARDRIIAVSVAKQIRHGGARTWGSNVKLSSV